MELKPEKRGSPHFKLYLLLSSLNATLTGLLSLVEKNTPTCSCLRRPDVTIGYHKAETAVLTYKRPWPPQSCQEDKHSNKVTAKPSGMRTELVKFPYLKSQHLLPSCPRTLCGLAGEDGGRYPGKAIKDETPVTDIMSHHTYWGGTFH